MKPSSILLPVFIVVLIALDVNTTQQKHTPAIPSDTTTSFKVGSYWVTPKPSFEFNSVSPSSGDTLNLATCAEYVYSPFGLITGNAGLKKSLLNNFSIVSRKESMPNGEFEFQILHHQSSKLILFFDDDPEASKESYILKGEIYDSDVNFDDNVKVGMTMDDFCKIFFVDFPAELKDRFKVIEFTSCVTAITHLYDFKDRKLASVKFVSDSYWKVNY